ncbi:Tic22 family protein [Leptolyngbya sp. PCC 6406]|uniref:Tic22 family protein n=1 Tax=Leptolyngbya sp. PCC 6406 TaxID=1173264 RepID=UPI0002ACDDF5|nr:Tic22 family protein [Leptolyngbya sp. PCC 6406]
MKGFLKQLTALGLIGGTFLGAATVNPQAVLALSDEEIVEKLSTVPVFMIVDAEGRSLTASVDSGNSQEVSVPIVFISGPSAEAFLAQAEAENAAIAETGQVAILSLGALYQEASTQLSNGQALFYVPTSESLAAASAIAEGQEFNGVPLFTAVSLENGQYLLTADGVLPVYFSLADLQASITPLFESNPELRDVIGVEVLTLEGLIQGMESNNPELDQLLELVRFVPDSATVQYLRQGQ